MNQKWKLDDNFVEDIGNDNYFRENTNQTMTGIKWDVFQAFLRGHMISYTSSKSREFNKEKRKLLESRIQILQEQVFRKNNPIAEKELMLLKAEYNELSAARAAPDIIRLNKTFYDQGENPGRLLAWQIKLETRKTIISIKL